jgi:tetratricopeptide (TPR) repeat protein
VLAQQQNWEKAILAYQKALELQPTFAGAYRNLAKVLERVGKAQEAAICRYRALSLEPLEMTAEDCVKLGNSLIIQGKSEEATACYQRAVELNPNLSPAYHNLGEIFSNQQEWEAAIAAYRQAIAVKAENGRSYYGLAKALVRLERWEEAVRAYQQAIQLKVSSAEIYQQLGDVLTKLQRWEEAVSGYRQGIELNSDNSWAHNNLGDALIQLQQWEEAVVAYRRAIALNPEFHWSYYNLGEALAQLQQWDEAVRTYQQAVKLQPDLPWISQKLGDALRQRAMSDLAAALGCYRQAIQEHPEDLQNYHKALEIQPDDAKLYVQLANGLAKQGKSDGAIVFYQMALQLQPDNSEGLRQLEELSKKKVTQAPNVSLPERLLTSDENQTEDVRLIAFYLPQYHPIPENDLWWGKGFTEWTNVTKAQPLFEGHYQPHLPADLGFYDLRVPEVREQQAALARQYGIYGFCYYYYWFAGKRLLHHPIDEVLRTKKPDFPFCICWANENWTRRWDGHDNEILMAQDCSNDEQNQAFAEHIVPILLDDRYIRVNGAPLLIIYRVDLFPNLLKTSEQWRDIFRKNGVGEVHLCVALTFGFDKHPHDVGFDSAVQFPPNTFSSCEISPKEVGINDFSGKIFDYKSLAVNTLSQQSQDDKVFLSVMTSWDNTARRKDAAHIYANSSPEIYEFWLRGVIEKTKQVPSRAERLVFINAWNEWAEGAHLEPDIKYGHTYLTATKKVLLAQHSWKTAVDILRYCTPNNAQHLEKLITDVCERIANAEPDLQAVYEALVNVGLINYLKSYPNLTPKSSKLLQDLEMLTNYYQS